MEFMDMFMIILFLTAVSFIIGLNIVSVVDSKLGRVEVNVPRPTLIVNVQKNSGEIEMFVEDNSCKMIKKDVDKDKIEHFDVSLNKTESINPTIVEKENILTPATVEKVNIIDKTDTGKTDILNPDESDVVDYGQYICYKKNSQVKIPKDYVENKCKNDSLNRKFKTGDKYTERNSICTQSLDETDPQEFYKTMYRPRTAIMEDPKLKGYNIDGYNGSAGIYDIGKIGLDAYEGFPKPNNYLFTNNK
jgi:hypothetical protein